MGLKEAYLHDYLAICFIGDIFGLIGWILALGAEGNWGLYIASLIISGLFVTLPGGFVASYLHMRLHVVGENLEMGGLSVGLFTAIVYTIITLFITIVRAIAFTALAGNYFISWIISVLFAFIFFMLGGYVCGMLERRPFSMPGIFDLSRIRRGPPPPPELAAQTCPTCGQPLTFVQQYNRWYCPNCKKYV